MRDRTVSQFPIVETEAAILVLLAGHPSARSHESQRHGPTTSQTGR